MRQLLPEPDDVDPLAAHASAARPAPPDRPWLLLNMIASIDGATAVEGVSGGLGGPADKEVFRAVRAVADVILVAAGTARAEQYGPPRTSDAVQAMRRARGQTDRPRLALVSRSLELDPELAVFAEADEPPLVLTVDEAPSDAVARLSEVAEVVRVGPGSVRPVDVLRLLGERGHRVVVGEGGPSLNGQLVEAGVVDEVNLTLSPTLVGGRSGRVAVGGAEHPLPLPLAHLWEADGLLFGRFARR